MKVLLRQSLLAKQRSSPVPTECSATLFEFAPVEGRQVVAGFDGGAITSDAGALLLGETNRAIQLTARLATCFTDGRVAALV
ncbi:MAG: transposase [Mycobacteriaceae bacterium]|nr:transposase [Mycobacteriaceae bacterium]